jgi:release factor glutamine methyltransferase
MFTNNEEFFSLWLYVDNRVLIPRNDTEILVSTACKEIKNNDTTLIDVGTGSGCIAIAVLKNIKFKLPLSYCLDISNDALEVATINISYHHLDTEIFLTQSDLLEVFISWKYQIHTKNILFTANLPYIKDGDIQNIDPEVLKNEPHVALFWWKKTWFELYEKFIAQVQEIQKRFEKNITICIEIWFDQYEYSYEYLSHIWCNFEYYKDLNGIHRCIKITFHT